MRTTLCAVLLVLLAGATLAYSTCEEDLQQELERERKEDADSQGCRACGKIEIEAGPNCPAKGYDCDESLQVTSTVPSLGSCECAQLRCAAGNATLAVDGELVKKVSCKDLKWTTADGEAESAVCARECGVGICPPSPELDASGEFFFEPLAVRPPDDMHRCAWANCENGAVFVDDVGADTVYKGASSFACTGSRMWSYTGPREEKRNLKYAYCVKYGCKKLPYSAANSLCDTKYACYEATFVEQEEGPLWGEMTCPGEPLALRFTQNDTNVQPACYLGHWVSPIPGFISLDSEVMCVNCRAVNKDLSDTEKPNDSDIKTGVTCPDGYQLTIEYGDSKTQTKVDSMKCSSEFTWITEGEVFTGFENIDDMITKGTEWKVRCIPKECATLPFGQLNDVCTSKKYDCESATYEVDAGTGTMKCTDVGALRLDTEDTAIEPKCTSGVWKNGETAIPGTSAVRCINCPVPELVNDGQNGLPTISARNKEVSCDPGKGTLTIEIVAGGASTDYPVASLTCSAEFEWVASGSLGSYTSLTDAVNQGATWKAKCVTVPSTTCQSLEYGNANAFCTTKYTCTTPLYTATGDDGEMSCESGLTGALRRDSDDAAIIPKCAKGDWSSEGSSLPTDTKVRCIDCIDPKREATENPAPVLANRAVSCAPGGGQLTISYVLPGAPEQETPVDTLKCSPSFEWDTTGGTFGSFSTLAEAVSQGASWRAICRSQAPKDCVKLETTVDKDYCTKDNGATTAEDSDSRKYECDVASFSLENDDPKQAGMYCLSRPFQQRYADDVEKKLDAKCLNGPWQDYLIGTGIPQSTIVTCVRCRPLFQVANDAVPWNYKDPTTGESIICPSKSMYIDIRKDEDSVQKYLVTSVTCNMDTRVWEVNSGADLSPYTSLVDMLENKVKFAVRCLDAGEK